MEKQHIRLTTAEKNYLQELVCKNSLAVKVHKRTQVLLALDQGQSIEAVVQVVILR